MSEQERADVVWALLRVVPCDSLAGTDRGTCFRLSSPVRFADARGRVKGSDDSGVAGDAGLFALVPVSLFEFGVWGLPGAPGCAASATAGFVCQRVPWATVGRDVVGDEGDGVELIVERPGALDVVKARVGACVRVADEHGDRQEQIAEFATTVRGLLGLRDRRAADRVERVVMEATGVYWRAPWAILEDEFECLLVNARQVKRVPGRKTDA
jgi:hypothetical protein